MSFLSTSTIASRNGWQERNTDSMYIIDGGIPMVVTISKPGNLSLTLGCNGIGNVTVDWGDGSQPEVVTFTNSTSKYVSRNLGGYSTFQVKITSSTDYLLCKISCGYGVNWVNYTTLTLSQWGKYKFYDCSRMFYIGSDSYSGGIFYITAVDIPNMSECTSLEFLFWGATADYSNLNPKSFSNIDTSNVRSMDSLFSLWTNFNQPIGNWNTSNVTNMARMFNGIDGGAVQKQMKFNQPIGNWNTSNVTTMWEMFRGSSFNQPIGNWNTSNVTTMGEMFWSSSFNQPIGNWNTSNVTNMLGMFRSSSFNQSIGNWNTSNVTNMRVMFGDSQFNQSISNWNVSSVLDIDYMFGDARSFNQNLSNVYFSKVTSQPIDFSTNANTQWLANRATQFPKVNIGGTPTTIST